MLNFLWRIRLFFEANPAFSSKILHKNCFFLKQKKSSCGRFFLLRKNTIFLQNAFTAIWAKNPVFIANPCKKSNKSLISLTQND